MIESALVRLAIASSNRMMGCRDRRCGKVEWDNRLHL